MAHTFLYVKETSSNVIRMYDDMSEFFDTRTVPFSNEQKAEFIRYGNCEGYTCVTKQEFDEGDPLEEAK